MQATTLIVLALAIILSLITGFDFLASFLFLVLAVIILFYVLAKIASFFYKTGKSLSTGVMADVEKAKGQSPKGVAEIGKIFESVGAKAGEASWSKSKETYRSEDLVGRISTGSKSLLEAIGRLFK